MSQLNNNVKRIILTGAAGVGKTSLVKPLSLKLGLPIIPELGREICSQLGYQQIGEVPDQEGFKFKVLEAQIETENKLQSFISDRSTIDCWVLWQRWNICSAMTENSENYYQLAYKQAQKYTHIIYIPPMFPPVDDGFRWTNKDYQNQIDRMVRSCLYDWQLLEKTYTVKSKTIEDRLKEIELWLQA